MRHNCTTDSRYPHRTLTSQQRIQPSPFSSSYHLLQHPMIVQSRSTDSQLDVESSNLYSSRKYLNSHYDINTTMNPKNSNNTMVQSFFNRTHPSLLNESSESSSSSLSSISIQPSKENVDCRTSEMTVTASITTATTVSQQTKMTATNLRRRRCQDIFVHTSSINQGGDDDNNDTDDDDDERDTAKRGKWDADIYDTHGNGLWIQRTCAFDDDDDESDGNDDDEVTALDVHPGGWTTGPLIR